MKTIHGRGCALLLAAVMAVGLPPLAQGPASAAPAPQEGVGLPTLLDPSTPQEAVVSASPQFLLHAVSQPDTLEPRTQYSVVRISDGETVRTFLTPAVPTALEPRLVGDAIVRLVEPDDTQRQVEVTDAATGDLLRIIDTTGHRLLHADSTWAMVSDTGATTGENTVRFVHADGTVVTVPGNFFSPPEWQGGDGDTAYVRAHEGDFALDPHTGARTTLDFPDQTRLYAVTPTHLIASAVSTPSAAGRIFRTLTRDNLLPGWSTAVTTDYRDRGFLPYGDGLAQLYLPDDAPTSRHLALRPVDLATGEVQAPVAEDVFGTRWMSDGRTALTLADTPGGRIAVASGPGAAVSSLTDLPDLSERASFIALSGDDVLATWEGRDDVWSTSSTGSSGWELTFPPGSADGRDTSAFSAAGDVVMSRSNQVSNSSGDRHRLRWPGGNRDFYANAARLGHGGTYVVRAVYRNGGVVDVSNVRSGAVAATFTGYDLRAVDENWVWARPDASAVMVGTDLDGVDPQREVSLPNACANAQVHDVRGRWAHLTCGGQSQVVDLQQALPSLPVGVGAELGRGFVTTTVADAHSPARSYTARVTDLVTREVREYGPLRSPGVAANDDGSPELAYVDTRSQVRHVVLDWLSGEAQAPVLTRNPEVPAAVASDAPHELGLSWFWSRGTSYDVRRGDRDGGNWVLPDEWQDLDTASVDATIEPASGACFSARARDAAGHESAWSPPVCQYVDGAAPVLTDSPQVRAAVASTRSSELALAWAWADPSSGLPDDESIASYDVRRGDRNAQNWGQPAAWQQLESPSVTATIPAGEGACFASRARDEAGNVSDWSPAVCRYVDGVAPRLTTVSGTTTYPAALRPVVSFAASGWDDEQVASYDVERVTAARSAGLGRWTRVVDAGAQARATTGALMPGSQVCFRARVRDEAGNVSAWSSARCSTAPVDDRQFTRTGRSAWGSSSGALGRTFVALRARGASATLPAQRGRAIGVWVLRGPGLGVADVYAAGRVVGRINFKASTNRRALVSLPVSGGFAGPVKVVSRGNLPVRIDAVAALR